MSEEFRKRVRTYTECNPDNKLFEDEEGNESGTESEKYVWNEWFFLVQSLSLLNKFL